jgi:hypothetical protein
LSERNNAVPPAKTASRWPECRVCEQQIGLADLTTHGGIYGRVHQRCVDKIVPAALAQRIAQYGQQCRACNRWIERGEPIASAGEKLGWVHPGCVSR